MSLDELFKTFHDFDIVGLEYQEDNLIMTLRVPWGEMWNDLDFRIKVRLKDGHIIECNYFEYADLSDFKGSIDKFTIDPKTIAGLGLDIQRFKIVDNNEYLFLCNGYSKIGGGQIRIKAKDFKIYDNNDKEIPVEKYKSWHKEWWDNIFKP
jgi:hypothetical protein